MSIDSQELSARLEKEIRANANTLIEIIREPELDLGGEHDQLILEIGVTAGITAALSVLHDWNWISPRATP